MATPEGIFIPTSPNATSLLNGTIAAGARTTITLSARQIFAVTADGDLNIRFGTSTRVPSAAATDWPVWSTSYARFDTGEEFDRFSLFNNTGSTVTYWVYCLSAK